VGMVYVCMHDNDGIMCRREQELHAHLQECRSYRANWERLFKDRLCTRRGKRRSHLMFLRTGLSALRRANEWNLSPCRRPLLQRMSSDAITADSIGNASLAPQG
jgi:hypothetical protein